MARPRVTRRDRDGRSHDWRASAQVRYSERETWERDDREAEETEEMAASHAPVPRELAAS
jgi:hypothetical protein